MGREIQFEGRPVWAEIRESALAHNLRAIRRHIGRKPKILAVVKGNGYGHGAVEAARVFARAGADWFGATCSAEGAELREGGIRQPILVLTGFWAGEEKRILEHRLTPAITRVDQLRLLERAAARNRRARGRPIGFHLKIDTGMNRLGISPGEVDNFARGLDECPHLRLTGTFTHFASSEVFTSDPTEQQQRIFAAAIARLRELGLDPGIVHMANSAAVAARPDTWADMVRPGAILYGYHQFYDPPELRAETEKKMPLKPALSFRARVVSLREIAPGHRVGYNGRFVAKRPSRIAVLAVGYADGLRRTLGNKGRVILHGRFVPIVGTVSMDLAAVDVTGVDGVRLGDMATLYGAEGDAAQYVSDVARELGTVSSDLLCSLGSRVPRFYLR